jgi:predicted RNA-binding protein
MRDAEKKLVAKNVASVTVRDGKLVFTDIMGIPTVVDASIERIDLMDNFIWIREHD